MKKIFLLVFIFGLLIFFINCKEEKQTKKVIVLDINGEVYQELTEDSEYPLAMPEVEGYIFKGFERSVDEKTNDIILTPIYNRKPLKMVFLNGDDTKLYESNIEYGTKASIPSIIPTLEGYEFEKWDFDFDSIITTDLIVKPIFKKKVFVVRFYLDTELLKEENVEYGSNATAPDMSNIDHYVFQMWDKEFDNVHRDIDIHAFGYHYLNYGFYDMYHAFISSLKVATDACDPASWPLAPDVPYHTFVEWVDEGSNNDYDVVLVAKYTKDTTSLDKNTADYWIRENSDKYDVRKVIYTLDEINDINKNNIFGAYNKTLVVDVKAIDEVITGSKVKTLIEGYTNISKYTIYNDNGTVNSDSTSILNNRNLSGINTNVNVKFGLVTDFCNLRSYPTDCYSKDKSKDMFQETSLNVGEGVAIYHTSLDGKWYFVQAANYNGWIPANSVALCSKTEMVNFLSATEKVVVIANYVTINNHHVRMGQAFPLEKIEDDKYVIKFPTRNSNGSLSYMSYKVSDNKDYNLGYLPYTYENILKQGFKILGMSYSWGDKYETGRDCSSTQNAVLACFGFSMPRNTSNQRSIPTYSKTLSSLSSATIKTYNPGTLIFSSGHVMMYIGIDASGNPYILHNTTGGGANKCILQNFNEYTNTIIASLALSK